MKLLADKSISTRRNNTLTPPPPEFVIVIASFSFGLFHYLYYITFIYLFIYQLLRYYNHSTQKISITF